MIDDLRLDPATRDWLELGPVKAPDHVVRAAFVDIASTRQRRRARVPGRFGAVGASALVAAAVLLLVARAVPNPTLAPATGLLVELLRPVGAALPIPATWVADDGVALTIRGAGLDRVAYWRATSYDRIEAHGWSQTETRTVSRPAGAPLLAGTFDDAGERPTTEPLTVTVTPASGAAGLPVISPGLPRAVDQPVRLTVLGSAGFLGAVELEDPGSAPSYRVTGSVPVAGPGAGPPSATTLREAGTDYPVEIAERYLQLEPGTLGPEATALRDRIAAEAGSRAPFDLAEAAVAVLGSPEFTYSTDVRDLDCRTSTAECFATYRRGYCLHFATTMAAILRDLGVPTRLVQGFLPGTVTGDVATVRDRDAHAWVEVYFPGSGWVAFDPTAGFRASQAPVAR